MHHRFTLISLPFVLLACSGGDPAGGAASDPEPSVDVSSTSPVSTIDSSVPPQSDVGALPVADASDSAPGDAATTCAPALAFPFAPSAYDSLDAGPDAHPTPTVNYLALGDSITHGAGLEPQQAYPALLGVLGGTGIYVRNKGVNGQTLDNGAVCANYATGQLEAGAKVNVTTVMLGTNDLRNGVAASAIWTSLQRCSADLHAAGWKTILISPPACWDTKPSVETNRQALLALERAGAGASFDGFVDVGGDPILGSYSTVATWWSTPRYWFEDGIHPTANGTVRIAWSALPALARLLAQ